jgi:hypothetical protein
VRRTTSAPWGIAAIALTFVAFFFLTNTSYWTPAHPWTCASTPVEEVIQRRRTVTFVDVDSERRTTSNPCLEAAKDVVAIGAPVAALAAASATVAFRKRSRTPILT